MLARSVPASCAMSPSVVSLTPLRDMTRAAASISSLRRFRYAWLGLDLARVRRRSMLLRPGSVMASRSLLLALRPGPVEHGVTPGRDPVGGRLPGVPGEPGVVHVQPPRVANRRTAGRVPVLAHRRDHVAVGLGDRGREA